MLPRRPASDEIAVRDQHARSASVCAENADWFAALHEQRLVVAERPELADDGVVAFPVARGLSRPAVHNQILRPLGHIRIEVVHQQPERGFLVPSLARDAGASRRSDRASALCGCLRVRCNNKSCHVTAPMSAKRSAATAAMSADMSALSTRSATRRGTISRTRSCAVRTPRPGLSGALKSIACAPHISSIARMFSTLRRTRRAFHAAPIAMGTTSSLLPSVGIVSTLAGWESTLHSLAKAAAVT